MKFKIKIRAKIQKRKKTKSSENKEIDVSLKHANMQHETIKSNLVTEFFPHS